jgi:hypothetical protein
MAKDTNAGVARAVGLNWKARRRARRSAAEWARILQEQRSSGQSVRAFCAQRGLPEASVWYWRRRIESMARDEGQVDGGAKFLAVPVVVSDEALEVVVGDLRVRLGGGAGQRVLDAIVARIAGAA